MVRFVVRWHEKTLSIANRTEIFTEGDGLRKEKAFLSDCVSILFMLAGICLVW